MSISVLNSESDDADMALNHEISEKYELYYLQNKLRDIIGIFFSNGLHKAPYWYQMHNVPKWAKMEK